MCRRIYIGLCQVQQEEQDSEPGLSCPVHSSINCIDIVMGTNDSLAKLVSYASIAR